MTSAEEMADMYAGWMIAGMVLGALAAAFVWMLLVALVVTWVEDRRQHHHHAG
jgi:ethanolamine transporter EutH